MCLDIDWEVFDLWLDGTPEGICVGQLRYKERILKEVASRDLDSPVTSQETLQLLMAITRTR